MSKAGKRISSTISKERKNSQHSEISSESKSENGSESDFSQSSGGDDDKLNKYYKTSKKLNKEKAQLKTRLERLSARFRQREREFTLELERSQNYLKEQLNAVCEERENLKRSFQSDREKLKTKLTAKLEKYRKYLEKKYIKSAQDIKDTCEATMASMKENLKKEIKEKEQAHVLALQGIKGECDLKVKKLENEKDHLSLLHKTELDKLKADTVRHIETAVRTKAEEMKRDFEKRLTEHNKTNQTQLESMRIEYEQKIELITRDSLRKLEAMTNDLQKKSELLQRAENNLKNALTEKEKSVSSIKLDADKRVGELQDICKKLQEQVSMLQGQNRKLQENMAMASSQAVSAFAKQKEMAEKEIHERNRMIESLEYQLRGIGKDSLDKVNALEKKFSSTASNLTELTSKLTEKEREFDKLNEEHIRLGNEHLKTQMEATKNAEALTRLRAEVNAKNLDVSSKDRQILNLQKTIDSQKQTLQQAEGKSKETEATIERLEKQIRNLKNELEICNRTISTNKDEHTRLISVLEREHKHTLSLSDSEKTREIQSLTDRIEQLNVIIASQRTNLDTLTKSLNTVNSECAKLREISEQHGSAVEMIKKKDTELTSMRLEYNRMKANLAQGLNINAKGHTEREKELTDLRAKLKDTESKDVQLKVLKDQMANVQQFYGNKVGKLEEEIKRLQTEHETTLSNVQEKHRKEIEALNATLVEQKIKMARLEALAEKK